jgi:serine/threonine protein kinase
VIGQQFGKYRLMKLLSEGGFAQVYLGKYIHLRTLAAIKVLTTKLMPEGIAQFCHEARLMMKIDHPHTR